MNDNIFNSIKNFLDDNKSSDAPLLLGYSGGFDSKALLYLLHRYKEKYGLDLHIAHVDHKWRASSTQEALDLQKEAESLNLTFHLKTLKKIDIKNNLEAYYREQRIEFFQTLFEKHSYKALLLAHQKDDLSETVLKRMLEGADLPFLKGMEKISILYGLPVWRPLLDVTKKELIDWLQTNDLVAIDDETNRDTKYLRSRMREKIIPSLTDLFGKKILENLVLTSHRSAQLNQYLDKKVDRYLINRVDGPFGTLIDFTGNSSEIELIEMRYLLKKIGKELSIDFSRDVISRITESVIGRSRFSLSLNGADIMIENSRLFILNSNKLNSLDQSRKLEEGVNTYGDWIINIDQTSPSDPVIKCSSWLDVWRGSFSVVLPKMEYVLHPPKGSTSYYNKRLTKWFSENKVPSFLRFFFPVIFKDDKMFYEFLSGKKRFNESIIIDPSAANYYKISFKLSC